MLLTRFRCFFFWLWLNHFCLFCVHLMLVCHSVQLSHAWSDFSHLLRVILSETRILCHFILVLLTLMKQLTYNVGIISLIRIFRLDIYHWLWWSSWHAMLALFLLFVFLVWIFSWRDLFQVTGTDASCVNLFSVHNLWESHALFFLLRLVCCIVGITLWRFASHLLLFVFGSI